jgi:hypothetical protein
MLSSPTAISTRQRMPRVARSTSGTHRPAHHTMTYRSRPRKDAMRSSLLLTPAHVHASSERYNDTGARAGRQLWEMGGALGVHLTRYLGRSCRAASFGRSAVPLDGMCRAMEMSLFRESCTRDHPAQSQRVRSAQSHGYVPRAKIRSPRPSASCCHSDRGMHRVIAGGALQVTALRSLVRSSRAHVNARTTHASSAVGLRPRGASGRHARGAL